MSEFRTTTVSKGLDSYGGPLTIIPDGKHDKVVYIASGGRKPEVVDRIVELIGAEAINGFNTQVPDNEHFCMIVGCGGSLRCSLYPKRGIPTINAVPTGKTGPLAQHIHEGIYVSAVGIDQVRPAGTNEAAEAQAVAAVESVQGSVPTREDGHFVKLTEQMATKQKKSLLKKIGLGAGKVTTAFYQVGRNAVQMMINTILPFVDFVAVLIGTTQTSDLDDQFPHLLVPFAGSGWGLMALGLICSLPFLSPLLGPGAAIAQIVDTLIGVKIRKGSTPPRLSLPALFTINTQNAYDFIPVDMGLGEAEPETIKVGVPAVSYSRFLNGVPCVVIAWLASIGLYPQS